MRLRVRDLRQYLLLRNISTDTCREKEDLVDLVLCHRAFEAEDEEEEEEENEEEVEDDDDDEEVEDPNTASLLSHIHRTLTDSIAPPASELSAATLEESLSWSESPETNQVRNQPESLITLQTQLTSDLSGFAVNTCTRPACGVVVLSVNGKYNTLLFPVRPINWVTECVTLTYCNLARS